MTTTELLFGLAGLVLGGGLILLYSFVVGRGAQSQSPDDSRRRRNETPMGFEKTLKFTIKELELKREAEAERKLSQVHGGNPSARTCPR